MVEEEKKLPDILLERGLITVEQLKRIEGRMEQEQRNFLEVLKEERFVFPEALAQVLAELYEVPYVDLGTITSNEKAMRHVSRQAAATYRFFAFDERDNKLLVAMDDPTNFQAIEAIQFIAKKRNLSPEIYLASEEAISRRLGSTAEIQAEIGGALRDFDRELDSVEVSGREDEDLGKIVEDAPVTKVVAVIIRHAIEGHASDIHIEPTAHDLKIRYRIDGKLHTSLLLPLDIHPAVISRIKILANLKIDESRLPQDGRFTSRTEGRAYDFRVSTMPTVYGEKAALRILDKSKGAPSLEDLGLRGDSEKRFVQHLSSPHGIILISGPTGSGKSTTLFSALNLINKPETNIATLEDPVEYDIPGVNQTQINPEIGLSFASGLRSLLRQDPDVLMVGEIRDGETATLAVHASLTGHLVLSTIHTNDAVGTIPRLVDMGVEPFLLTATLRLLVAQRLVSRLCDECKKEVPVPSSLRAKIEDELNKLPNTYQAELSQLDTSKIYQSTGCPACSESGIVGRLAIFEVVPLTRQLRDIIIEQPEYDTLYDTARQEGFITMRQDGLLKALRGEVHYQDVIRVTSQDTAQLNVAADLT